MPVAPGQSVNGADPVGKGNATPTTPKSSSAKQPSTASSTGSPAAGPPDDNSAEPSPGPDQHLKRSPSAMRWNASMSRMCASWMPGQGGFGGVQTCRVADLAQRVAVGWRGCSMSTAAAAKTS